MRSEIISTSNGLLSGRHVIFVFNNLDLGGAERQGLLLARHLMEVEKAAVQVWDSVAQGEWPNSAKSTASSGE